MQLANAAKTGVCCHAGSVTCCLAAMLGPSLLLASGCGRLDVELVSVNGCITLEAQPMPGAGTLYFTPVEAVVGQPKRPATAQFGKDGNFRASSFDTGDGLVPGRYRVAVHCWEIPLTVSGPPSKSFILARYTVAATSQLELVVPSGKRSMTWNVDLAGQ